MLWEEDGSYLLVWRCPRSKGEPSPHPSFRTRNGTFRAWETPSPAPGAVHNFPAHMNYSSHPL